MATTRIDLTNTWVSVSSGEMTIQRSGAGNILLADSSSEPIDDKDAFTLNDYEPRKFDAPTDGNWWAKTTGAIASVVVQEV